MHQNFRFGREYDTREIIADGVVHAIGIALALIGATVLVFNTTLFAGPTEQAAAWIYSIGLIAALSISFTYNMLPVNRWKWRMRRLDHSAIFVLIAATYTPFLLRKADDPTLFNLLIAIWCMAAIGMTIKCVFPGRYDRIAIGLYLLMGWSGLLAFRTLTNALPGMAMILVLIGGVVYTIGIAFHVWEKLRFQNAIWHAFVVTAASLHYSAVLMALQPD